MKEKIIKIKWFDVEGNSSSAFISTEEKKKFLTNSSPNPWIKVADTVQGNTWYLNTNHMESVRFEE